ncbi:MAG: FkbM family methyltransferase [Alphaproteobacteria bacterium]|nr:FkbM family methyltransferase [Alphaproteobacteria bacterium]
MVHDFKNTGVVFDLGMNNGDDTEYYLRKGFGVVAVEANPILCEAAEKRFEQSINDGRLSIVNAAIWERVGETSFFINTDNDHWSSLDTGWAGRESSNYQEIKVKCVTLDELFNQYDVPHYLKIDVEGVDHIVLEQLQNPKVLPAYVSVEDCRFGFRYMKTLAACGYKKFKLSDQSIVNQLTDSTTGQAFPAGSSGPFGDDLPGEWLSYVEMVELYSTTVRDKSGNRLAPRTHWWDIHCTKH